MRYLPLILILINCTSNPDCKEKLNLLPMFGNQIKCAEQIEADSIFLHECDSVFKKREVACKYHIQRGWDYFNANILDTSMMRFNQAWLLDSTNAEVYLGFGDILGKQMKFKESLIYFAKSMRLNPNNPDVWESASISYGQLFFQSKDVNQLNISIYYLKRSMKLNPKNARVYGQLAASYSYFMQQDSAKKYLKLTDKIDPNAVNPEVRKILNSK